MLCFYSNLKDAFWDSQEMKNACKVAKRCYEKLENGDCVVNRLLRRKKIALSVVVVKREQVTFERLYFSGSSTVELA